MPKDKLDLPCIVASRGRNPENPSSREIGVPTEQQIEINREGTSNCITTVQKDNWVLEPCILTKERTEFGKQVRKEYEQGKTDLKRAEMTEYAPRKDGCSGTITTVQKDNYVMEYDGNMADLQYLTSIKDKDIVGDGKKELSRNASVGDRVYDSEGIAATISAEGGGVGGHSGLYKVDNRDAKIEVVGNYKPSGHNCGRIVEPSGVAPTVMENHGAVTAILEEKKSDTDIITVGNYSPSGYGSSVIVEPKGVAPAVMEHHGTVTAVVESSDNQPSKADVKKTIAANAKHQQDLVNDSDDISATLVAGSHLNSDTYTKTVVDAENHKYPFRIRKLTPKECWRLQGFDDFDIEKCISDGVSASQLYKQAGNSIAVPCLEAIFANLLGIKRDIVEAVDDDEMRLF